MYDKLREAGLLDAIELDDFDKVKRFVEEGYPLNSLPTVCRVDAPRTPLESAVRIGNIEIVKYLLESGAQPNLQKHSGGDTSLHAAAIRGDNEILQQLLKYGGDPLRVDYDGNSPLHYAAMFANLDTAKMLLDLGADPDQKNRKGETPRDYAIERFLSHEQFDALLKERKIGPDTIGDACPTGHIDHPKITECDEKRERN